MKQLFLYLLLLLVVSCGNNTSVQQSSNEKSEHQEKLLHEGWTFKSMSNGEINNHGIKPIYGLQDNYFDITMGESYNVAVKIVDAVTDKCIRYVYVCENSTTTISQIPQGRYYLKLAYGKDWMELSSDDGVVGKFTKNAFYEKSCQVYDFGKKNSKDEVNYELKINVRDEVGMNNFETKPISEEEFLK